MSRTESTSEFTEVALSLSCDHPVLEFSLYRILRAPLREGLGERGASGRPVLLLHGASANHRTFCVPRKDFGLAGWLVEQGFDPWLLNWRGSSLVFEEDRNTESFRCRSDVFNFNAAAARELPKAIEEVKKTTRAEQIGLLGFCMGSAVIAEAIALGRISHEDVSHVVLMTLGLFYEAPVDGRLKSEDRLLELLKARREEEPFSSVDPRVSPESPRKLRTPWPVRLEKLYDAWPGTLKSHRERALAPPGAPPRPDARLGDAEPLDPVRHLCNRVTFMYGTPYRHENLVEEVHAQTAEGEKEPWLAQLFGAIPLDMYIHAARNLRLGHAGYYYPQLRQFDNTFISHDAHARYRAMKKVTLITGALNRLWHRDSMDLMYEWLKRGSADHHGRFHKFVIPNYAHQDLLWGVNAKADVWGHIKDGLTDVR